MLLGLKSIRPYSHEWKLIPMHFINNALGKNFIFHSNLSFKTSVLHQLLCHLLFTQTFFNHRKEDYLISLTLLNNYITIDNDSVHFKYFSSRNINFINQLFTSEG